MPARILHRRPLRARPPSPILSRAAGVLPGCLAAVCLLALVPSGAVRAQQPSPEEGARIRITASDLGLSRSVGTFEGAIGDSLTVRLEGVECGGVQDLETASCQDRAAARDVRVRLARSDVDLLEVSTGERRRQLEGLGYGVLAGAGVGALIGLATWDEPVGGCWFDCSKEQQVLFAALGMAIPAGFAGLIIGSQITTDRWEPVRGPPARAALYPFASPDGAGLMLSVSLPSRRGR